MKKALILLALFPLLVFAQRKKSIDGFLDIPFGSDSVTVKNEIVKRGGIKIDSLSEKDMLSFSGLTLANRKTLFCVVKFVDNKAYEADLGFADFDQMNSLSYYDDLAEDIAAVYGAGQTSNNFGNSNNEKRIKRLIAGSAFGQTVWRTKNKNTIFLYFQSINGSLQIILQYQDHGLWNLNSSKRRSSL